MKRSLILALASLLLGLPALAQKSSNMPAPKEKTAGPSSPRKSPPIQGQITVGDVAPGFELDDPAGRSVALRSLRGSWIVLAFSDRWQQVQALQDMGSELRGMNARVVGVCHEKAHTLSGVSRREKLTMLLLADPTGQVSSMYGLYNHQTSETRPGFLVLDPHGTVQLTVLGQLPPNDVIVQLARFAITRV
jgi:peroxiredoxin